MTEAGPLTALATQERTQLPTLQAADARARAAGGQTEPEVEHLKQAKEFAPGAPAKPGIEADATNSNDKTIPLKSAAAQG